MPLERLVRPGSGYHDHCHHTPIPLTARPGQQSANSEAIAHVGPSFWVILPHDYLYHQCDDLVNLHVVQARSIIDREINNEAINIGVVHPPTLHKAVFHGNLGHKVVKVQIAVGNTHYLDVGRYFAVVSRVQFNQQF